jgi:DNA-directed RNA polymerase subunit RPC12/RpoP
MESNDNRQRSMVNNFNPGQLISSSLRKGLFEMRRRDRMMKPARPRRRLHAVVWLLGLAILAWTGRWWPGILILVAISILLEAAVKRNAPQEFENVQPSAVTEKPEVFNAPQVPTEMSAPPPQASPVQVHRTEWLPLSCPRCGAPTRAAEVRWAGDASAACPYCGSNLPLKKA